MREYLLTLRALVLRRRKLFFFLSPNFSFTQSILKKIARKTARGNLSSNHSISDFVAFGLSVINGGNDCRKTKEMRLIHALGTLNSHGINERFTFC